MVQDTCITTSFATSLVRGGVMRGEVLGIEQRRRWDDDEKLAIVSAVGVGGATVTQVAQRHEMTRQQIYAWRHELKRKGLWSPDAGALFLPVGGSSISPKIISKIDKCMISFRLNGRKCYNTGAISWVLAG